jgi:hypothetical protein
MITKNEETSDETIFAWKVEINKSQLKITTRIGNAALEIVYVKILRRSRVPFFLFFRATCGLSCKIRYM